MENQFRLLLKPKDVAGPARQETFNGDDSLEVRDVTTKSCVTIRARDLSIYRHSLLFNGTEFRILNMARS